MCYLYFKLGLRIHEATKSVLFMPMDVILCQFEMKKLSDTDSMIPLRPYGKYKTELWLEHTGLFRL